MPAGAIGKPKGGHGGLNIVQSSTSIFTAAEVFFTDLGANPLGGALAGPNVTVGRCFNDISTPDSDTGANVSNEKAILICSGLPVLASHEPSPFCDFKVRNPFSPFLSRDI